MLLSGSRYAQGLPFTPATGIPAGLLRAREIPAPPGVVEHTMATSDRMDLMGQHYYSDPQRWWVILDANPTVRCAGDLEAPAANGHVIQIPAAR